MNNNLQTEAGAAIIIVDDVPENLELLSEILSSYGYFVRTASSGLSALAMIAESPPDIIMLDVMMPGMDGYEVCQKLKADEATRNIPIIFITALQEPIQKVRAFAVGAADYVTKPFQLEEVIARIRTHLALYRSNKQLQEQVAELDAFAHTVAHNLKNPLAAIATYLDMVTRPIGAPLPPEKTAELLTYVQQSALKANNIVDELLLLSSVRKEAVTLHNVDMAEVVAQVQERLEPMISKYRPEIVEPAHWPTAVGYAPWVAEIWANYISNGLKYGGQPPRLQFGATPQADGMVRFWLHDNGRGLTEAERAIVFTEFTRLNEIRTDGHGLGLSIVQRIVNKLGGTSGVESTVGEGSTFYFTLPAAPEA